MFKTTAGRAVPQRVASEETRRHILDTSLALFREKGFEATTMRDIAGGSGLSLGSAYYYFKSKEAIVAAYYDFVQQEHLTTATAVTAVLPATPPSLLLKPRRRDCAYGAWLKKRSQI